MGRHYGSGRDYIGDCTSCGAEFWGAYGHPDDEFDEQGGLVWFCPPCEKRRDSDERRATLKAMKATAKAEKAALKFAFKAAKEAAKAAARLEKQREKAAAKEAKLAAKTAAQVAAGKAVKAPRAQKKAGGVSPKARAC